MLIGLVKESKKRVEATFADKRISYICPGCEADVRLAKGRIRRPYFGHRPGATCSYGAFESWEHQQAKEDFAAAYRGRGFACEIEAEVLSGAGDRRADVLLHPLKGDYAIAIEVQHSPLDYTALEVRTAAYFECKTPVIWVPILQRKRLDAVQRIEGTDIFYVGQYGTPAWQTWLHDLHGQLWFYDPVSRGLWRARLDACMSYKNPTSYFADGQEQSGGGYWYESSRWDSLFLEGPYSLASARIHRVKLQRRKRRSYVLPAGIAADFLIEGDPVNYRLPAKLAVAKVEHGQFNFYRVEHIRDDQWHPARLEPVSLPEAIVKLNF